MTIRGQGNSSEVKLRIKVRYEMALNKIHEKAEEHLKVHFNDENTTPVSRISL